MDTPLRVLENELNGPVTRGNDDVEDEKHFKCDIKKMLL